MRKTRMPKGSRVPSINNVQWELSPSALEHWAPGLKAADFNAATDNNVISILDPIGQDPWTGEGVTAKRISAALRSIGPQNDVVVNVNSPGGDLFEGMAIYSLLREHEGKVTVRILGIAASAASIIAMAGDEVLIGRAGFLMIHNTWVVAIGNRNDLRDVADTLEPFDQAMADIYAARSGIEQKKVLKMMDKETWIRGQDAIDQGFADNLLPSDAVSEQTSGDGVEEKVAAHLLDMALAKAGISRSERRALLQQYKGGSKSSAAPAPSTAPVTPSADEGDGKPNAADSNKLVMQDVHDALRRFNLTI